MSGNALVVRDSNAMSGNALGVVRDSMSMSGNADGFMITLVRDSTFTSGIGADPLPWSPIR
jgi:hypothetical protein